MIEKMKKFPNSRVTNWGLFLILSLIVGWFIFPFVAAFLVEPYQVTLKYEVQKEGAYLLKFDRYLFLDPSVVFNSIEDKLTTVRIKNTGTSPAFFWISNYGHKFINYKSSVINERMQDRPGILLDDEGSLGAQNQPYRTLRLNSGEQVEVSFLGDTRTIDCPIDTELVITVDKIQTSEVRCSQAAPYNIFMLEPKREKETVLIIPPYAFGKFHIEGADGFNLKYLLLSQAGSSETTVTKYIPFPYTSFIFTVFISSLIIILGKFLIKYLINIFKLDHYNTIGKEISILSGNDGWFLFTFGLVILTFMGSVPMIHMLDSIFYVRVATNILNLFNTFSYPTYRNPGYMIFIWILQKIMGPGYGLIIIQEFLFFITVFMVYKLVEFFTNGNRLAAWLAAILYVINPINLIFSQFIQPEGLWRDLIIIWAFSLIYIVRKKTWAASVIGGLSLGFLLLSRNSALPSVIAFAIFGTWYAWKMLPVKKYLFISTILIVILYGPYYLYLNRAGNQRQAYFSAIHHAASFIYWDHSLDRTAPCYVESQQDFESINFDRFPNVLPWMVSGMMSDKTEPNTAYENEKAIAFEKCVYVANYLRFPKQQLGIFLDRFKNYLWKYDLKDMDLWDYGKIYTLDFVPGFAKSSYTHDTNKAFTPYFYSEKWDVQDKPSLWKSFFELDYQIWPYIDLLIVTFSFVSTLFFHIIQRKLPPEQFQRTVLLVSAFCMFYLLDAIMYSIFGIAFSRRMMVAVSPLLTIVFGINLGMIYKIFLSGGYKQ